MYNPFSQYHLYDHTLAKEPPPPGVMKFTKEDPSLVILIYPQFDLRLEVNKKNIQEIMHFKYFMTYIANP